MYYLRLVIAASFFAFLLFPLPRTRAHEPVTTKVMFNKEVIRILERHCLACHAPGKIKSDIPLTTYEEARPWAKAIKEEVLEKRMIPFQAVKGYGSFVHDYTVPKRDVELLVSWIEGGAPRGEAKDYPKEEIDKLITGKEWPLGPPDLILQPDEETKIEPAGPGGNDETRCFIMPTNLKEDRWINAIDFQPGAGAVVHSASLFVASGPSRVKAGALNACPPSAEPVAQWAPGQEPGRLPTGAAIKLPAKASIVMQIRYRRNAEAASDRSSAGLYFAKDSISKLVRNVTINAPSAVIPANAESHRIKASYTINEATEAVAIRPLIFPMTKSIEVSARRPDGSVEVLIWAKDYRSDWQPAYIFKKPVALPAGARIEVTAYLDISENKPNAQPAETRFDGALCELSLTAPAPSKQARLRR
ncbi:MAG TPA: hypothetical protein VFS27_05815 [Blastocatellia bacterium]|jgi:hypothetical protein|nr:hypothetical protein [Blastocatellia bacterium]